MRLFLDRLLFFKKKVDTFSGDHGIVINEDRSWENSYRSRWQHDKIVRFHPWRELYGVVLLENLR